VHPQELVFRVKPKVVINCAAYTNVDAAERDPPPLFEMNVAFPARLAATCEHAQIPLITFSSSYAESPINKYGVSKKIAEEWLLANYLGNTLIVRANWVWGPERRDFPRNSIDRCLSQYRKDGVLRLPNRYRYEKGTPTYGPKLAKKVLDWYEDGITGLYEYSSTTLVSRLEWVRSCFQVNGIERLEPVFYYTNASAPRPRISGFPSVKGEPLSSHLALYREDVANG